MNEEIDKALQNINILIELFEQDNSNYKALCAALTTLKLMIGIEKFAELPTFDYYLQKTSKLLYKELGDEA